jgi:hydroxymethylpyrimidine/phosphomethylpyrimidine kinase
VIPPRILVIAGSDSGGGAGIQADIKTVTMFGGHAMTAITAITAQNTLAVEDVLAIPTLMVLKQIDMVVNDLGVDAVKIGMIGSAETANAVADVLALLDGTPIVFDPVMVASSGSALADEATVAAFQRLIGIAALVTPNAPELEALTGRSITSIDDLEQAAIALAEESGTSILAKGGHVPGATVIDLLVEADGTLTRFESERIETTSTHGTGCTLASGIACGLGEGRTLAAAVERARQFTRAAIEAAPGFGGGHGPMGHALGAIPFDLIHNILDRNGI